MVACWARFFILVASLLALPLCCFAIKSNDFTRSSAIGSRRYRNDNTNDLKQKTSQFGEKRLDLETYYDSSKRVNLGDERSHWNDDISNIDTSSRAYGASRRFPVPEYNGDTKPWNFADKRASFVNSDRNLTKKYNGKIDINKRNTDYQNFIKDYYGELVERSMEDINKYYSRTSTGSNDKFLQRAGGKLLGEDEEGFFDFLSSDEKIKRKSVSFRGVDNSSISVKRKPESTSVPKGETLLSPQTSYVPVSPSSNSGNKMLRIDDDIKETVIDAEQARGLQFLNVPDQFRSKATIKVKVKD